MNIAPTKGNCTGRNGNYNHCGVTDIWLACKSRGQCKRCSDAYKAAKKNGNVNKQSHTIKQKQALAQLEFIKNSREYYLRAIIGNQIKNEGKCRCEECNAIISHPTGINVSHIVGSGANKRLYHALELPCTNMLQGSERD